jgi:AbrB family looped-hinge helix DNA binding protein
MIFHKLIGSVEMTIHLQISANGRIVIPKQIREILGIKTGGTLVANLINDTLQITSVRNSISNAQNLVRKYCSTNNSKLVDDLFAMRKEEVEKEHKADNLITNSND